MSDATDPLSLVYMALWSMLESHSGFTGLVVVGNRVKYDKFLQVPTKDSLQDADVPEVGVVPIGSTYGLQITSNGTKLVERYETGLMTGKTRLAQVGAFLPIKWEVLRAFSGWEAVLKALTWKSEKFVKLLKVNDVVDTLLGKEHPFSRGMAGWVSMMRFEVTMFFRTADLQPS